MMMPCPMCGSSASPNASEISSWSTTCRSTIYRGEFFSLLAGPSCGKITLLHMPAGFETPTAGQKGAQIYSTALISPRYRPQAAVEYDVTVLCPVPPYDGEQNVAFGLKQEGLPKAEFSGNRVADVVMRADRPAAVPALCRTRQTGEAGLEAYRAIVAALKHRDADEASTWMARHIDKDLPFDMSPANIT